MDSAAYIVEILLAEKHGQLILSPVWGDFIQKREEKNSVAVKYIAAFLTPQNQISSVGSLYMEQHIQKSGDENQRKEMYMFVKGWTLLLKVFSNLNVSLIL